MNVKEVYLNGILKEKVYMKQPEGYDNGIGRVCLLPDYWSKHYMVWSNQEENGISSWIRNSSNSDLLHYDWIHVCMHTTMEMIWKLLQFWLMIYCYLQLVMTSLVFQGPVAWTGKDRKPDPTRPTWTRPRLRLPSPFWMDEPPCNCFKIPLQNTFKMHLKTLKMIKIWKSY